MTDDSKPKDDELSHDEDQEVVDSASSQRPAAPSQRPHSSDAGDDDDDDDDDEPAPAAKSVKPKSGLKSKKGKKSKAVVAKARASVPPSASSGSSVGLIAAVALIAGAAAGWFAKEATGKAPSAELHSAAAGETACKAWTKELCKGAGDKSSACTQAKEVSELLPESACNAALADVPATLTKVKDARKECTKLVGKLCTDLGKETATCKMVTERTESFPTDRCKEMLGNYDKVLGQLKVMEERGGPAAPGGPGGPGGPHGGNPHGAGPHGMGMPKMQAGPGSMPPGVPPGAIRLGGVPKAPTTTTKPTPAPAPAAPAPKAP